eukprot:3705745-Karenia_brevis.AAC.1
MPSKIDMTEGMAQAIPKEKGDEPFGDDQWVEHKKKTVEFMECFQSMIHESIKIEYKYVFDFHSIIRDSYLHEYTQSEQCIRMFAYLAKSDKSPETKKLISTTLSKENPRQLHLKLVTCKQTV